MNLIEICIGDFTLTQRGDGALWLSREDELMELNDQSREVLVERLVPIFLAFWKEYF